MLLQIYTTLTYKLYPHLALRAQHTFHSSVGIPFTTVYLGHFTENHGEHYVSLIPNLNNNIDTSNGNDNYTEVVTSSDLNDPLGEVEDEDTNQTGHGACKVNVTGDMEDGGDDTSVLKLSCP